jgi:hypothetical protein
MLRQFFIGGTSILIALLWAVSVLVSLAVPVVFVWAAFKLVRHFTGG